MSDREISKFHCGGFESCEYCQLPVCADQVSVRLSRSRVVHRACLEGDTITERARESPKTRDLACASSQNVHFGGVSRGTGLWRAILEAIGLE